MTVEELIIKLTLCDLGSKAIIEFQELEDMHSTFDDITTVVSIPTKNQTVIQGDSTKWNL
jgi:hypothetical protein